MELGRKLKLCAAISVLAFLLKIVVFVSPGWAVVRTEVFVEPKDYILPEDDGLHADQPLEAMRPEKHEVSISFGIWYYKVCMRQKDDDDSDADKKRHRTDSRCYHGCYHRKDRHHKKNVGDITEKDDVKEEENDVPSEFSPARDFIRSSVEFAANSRHDLIAYVTIGLSLGVVGIAAAIKYARGGGVGKHCGRVACSTQVLSSFFFWLALIRVGTCIIQLNMFSTYVIVQGLFAEKIKFAIPWCLILGAVAAVIMGISSLFHLILISRNRKHDAPYSCKIGKGKTPIFAPEGYVPYFNIVEEAGPLPEKQPVT